MSKATEGDDRRPQPGHEAIHDDWRMPRPGSVIFGAMGYGKNYSAGANAEANAGANAEANAEANAGENAGENAGASATDPPEHSAHEDKEDHD